MNKVVVLLLLCFIASVPLAAAYNTPTIVKGVLADGKPAANAEFYIYSTNGDLIKSGKLNSSGIAEVNLTDSSTYIFLYKVPSYTAIQNYTIPTITDPANQTPVHVLINASSMYHVTINSTPVSVTAKLTPVAYSNFTYAVPTNYTIYTMMPSNITFPNKTQKAIAFYHLKYIKVGAKEYNNTSTVKVDMSGNIAVTAVYEKLPFMVSPLMAIGVIGILGVCIVAVAILKRKAAKAAVREVERRSRYFKKL